MTASKMALFPEKALELEHSPQLKTKLLALERDASALNVDDARWRRARRV
jgi:hypothetical protein